MGSLNWLLVAIAALFVIFIMRGYSRGFLRMAVSLAGLLLAVFVTTKLVPNITDILENSDYVYGQVYDKVVDIFHDINAKYNNRSTEEQNRVISQYELPNMIVSDLIINNTKEVYETLKVTLFEEYIAKYLTLLIIKSGTFVGLYAALAIIMWIILRVTGFLSRVPVIHGLNKYLGLAAGGALALLITWIFFFVLVMFIGNDLADGLLSDIKASKVLTFLFDSDILFQMF